MRHFKLEFLTVRRVVLYFAKFVAKKCRKNLHHDTKKWMREKNVNLWVHMVLTTTKMRHIHFPLVPSPLSSISSIIYKSLQKMPGSVKKMCHPQLASPSSFSSSLCQYPQKKIMMVVKLKINVMRRKTKKRSNLIIKWVSGRCHSNYQ